MQLLIVRHAKAVDRREYQKVGRPDKFRPLTAEGQRKFEKAVKGLQQIIPMIDAIISSEYIRAIETAHLLAETYPTASLEILSTLNPDQYDNCLSWFKSKATIAKFAGKTVVFVGHNPELSQFVSEICQLSEQSAFSMKKGAICCIICNGACKLQWYRTTSELFEV